MKPGAESSVRARRPVSVAIIAKNEAARIEDCLKSVAWADEIVVVDSGSTDDTCAIARRYTDKVVTVPWRGFGPQKQAAVDQATHDWILNVDCDERVTPELAEEIQKLLAAASPAGAYTVPRRTFLGEKEIRHCGWYPDRTIRLFDRKQAQYSDNLVHEYVVTAGTVGECRGHLMHYSFSGLAPLLVKLNFYSDLSARQMHERGRHASILDLTLRPAFAFFKVYVMRVGFLDGVEGLTVAVTNAMLTFSKYAKLRELERKRPTGPKPAD
ncbi:MAG TPA: glycosyltransferase family 2 protein [Burkholderiales bacterium]|nr:glycosyltransferase family 2 protein [Burkholderiales bacterium]